VMCSADGAEWGDIVRLEWK